MQGGVTGNVPKKQLGPGHGCIENELATQGLAKDDPLPGVSAIVAFDQGYQFILQNGLEIFCTTPEITFH